MRVSLLFLCMLCTPVLMWGQEPIFSFNKGEIKQKEYFEEIPFEFVLNKIIVPVQIKGKTYRFMVDTGASTSISKKLRDSLGFSSISKVQMTDATMKKDSVEVVLLKSFKLGNIEIENTPTWIFNISFLDCFEIDGIIGSNSLRHSVVQFSLPDKKLRITDNAEKLKNIKPEEAQEMGKDFQSRPFFELSVFAKGKEEGFNLELVFDSGHGGLLDLSIRNYYEVKKVRPDLLGEVEKATGNNYSGFLGAGADTLKYRIPLEGIGIGGVGLYNGTIQTIENNNSLLGTEVLEHIILTLDYPKDTVYITPIDETEKDVSEEILPIEPIFKNGRLEVGLIWESENYPNIHVGDEIIAINDFESKGKSECESLFMPSFEDDLFLKIITEDKEGKQHSSVIVREKFLEMCKYMVFR